MADIDRLPAYSQTVPDGDVVPPPLGLDEIVIWYWGAYEMLADVVEGTGMAPVAGLATYWV